MAEGTRIVLTGEFKGFDVNKYENKAGATIEGMVLVFPGRTPRYGQIVKVEQKDEQAVRALMEPYIGEVVTLECFDLFGLWFKALV